MRWRRHSVLGCVFRACTAHSECRHVRRRRCYHGIGEGATLMSCACVPGVQVEAADLNPDDVTAVHRFFERNSASVEVMAPSGKLVKVRFPRPVICHHLTVETRKQLMGRFDVSTADTKQYSLLDQLDVAHDEMHRRHVISRIPLWIAALINVSLWKNLSLFLAILINFLILFGYGVSVPVRGVSAGHALLWLIVCMPVAVLTVATSLVMTGCSRLRPWMARNMRRCMTS